METLDQILPEAFALVREASKDLEMNVIMMFN
jgi:preprotein translocase subunit SecA